MYRFAGDRLYVGGRYNAVTGTLRGMTQDIGIDRVTLVSVHGRWGLRSGLRLDTRCSSARVLRS